MTEKEKEKGFFGENFLAELFKIEDFIEPPDDLCAGYVPKGTMNDLEKAAYKWLLNQEPVLDGLEREAESIFKKYHGKDAFVPEEQELAVLEAQALLERKFEIIKQLLRVSIQERLKIPAYVRVQFSKGFIVAICAEHIARKPQFQTFITMFHFMGNGESPDIPPTSHTCH